MTGTGWGLRELCDEELALCFDLPDYFQWEDRYLRDIIPLQLCRSVVDSLTELFSEPPRSKTKLSALAELTEISSDQEVLVWLDSIQQRLPGSWADTDISDKAVKSDNSPVDFRPWHRRTQLVLPCHIRTLGVFERLGMKRWRRNVC